ncbi:inverted formin-2-like [Pongo pygmaeus]|uniref:inverted formin-2-like n=1 Tax=Pongo pygmaeus TaxID=9600 RepID=UPI00300DAFCE
MPSPCGAATGGELCGGAGRGAGRAVDDHHHLHHTLPAKRVLQCHRHLLQGEVDLLLGGGPEADHHPRLQEHDRAGGLGPLSAGCPGPPRPHTGAVGHAQPPPRPHLPPDLTALNPMALWPPGRPLTPDTPPFQTLCIAGLPQTSAAWCMQGAGARCPLSRTSLPSGPPGAHTKGGSDRHPRPPPRQELALEPTPSTPAS